jgi:hypothetical protein
MLKLLKRRPGDGISFESSRTPGQPLPNAVKPGASVTLCELRSMGPVGFEPTTYGL